MENDDIRDADGLQSDTKLTHKEDQNKTQTADRANKKMTSG